MFNIQNPFANMTPVVKNLVMINVLFYVSTTILNLAHIVDLNQWLSVYYPNSPFFYLWQVVSYMFMHDPITKDGPVALFHILLNMVALASIGTILEQTIGGKRFLAFYLICGVGALGCQFLVQAIEVHGIIGSFYLPHADLMSSYEPYAQSAKLQEIFGTPLLGASGAVFGVVTGFGMLYPNLQLMIVPIPVPIKAKYLVPGYIVIELVLGFLKVTGDDTAHFAHIGGALVGFLLIKLWRIQRPNNFY